MKTKIVSSSNAYRVAQHDLEPVVDCAKRNRALYSFHYMGRHKTPHRIMQTRKQRYSDYF